MRPATLDQVLRFFFRVDGRIGRVEYALGFGFIYALNTSVLTPGSHTITVSATDTDAIPEVGSDSVTATVVGLM